MKKQFLILLALMLFVSAPALAQKYGYLNLGNLLEEMPERKAADEELKTYREKEAAEGDVLVKKLEEDSRKLYEDMQKGILSKVAQAERQKELQTQQEAIYAFDAEFRQNIEMKRQELLLPILKRVDEAVQEVAKEEEYTMIFDASVLNALLFAEEAGDITLKVKAKLEMN